MRRNVEEIRARTGKGKETPASGLEIGIQGLKKNTTIGSAGNGSLGARKPKFAR
jgi:hypothetical protein